MLPAATLCDQRSPSPPQRSAATPRGPAWEPAIFFPLPPITMIRLSLVSWGLWLLEEPTAAINLVCCGPNRPFINPAGKRQSSQVTGKDTGVREDRRFTLLTQLVMRPGFHQLRSLFLLWSCPLCPACLWFQDPGLQLELPTSVAWVASRRLWVCPSVGTRHPLHPSVLARLWARDCSFSGDQGQDPVKASLSIKLL